MASSSPQIALIDYEAGNLKSVAKALEHIGAKVIVTRRPDEIAASQKIVLPGVGSFGHCIENLSKFGLVEVLQDEIRNGKPFLGICLGMQLLFESSEESPGVTGLGVFTGVVRKFDFNDLKIPHMGWNNVIQKQSLPLFREIPDQSDFYFVHSYYVDPADKSVVAAITDYGIEFCSMVAKDNVFACQFHPEKSQTLGLQMIKNFVFSRS